MDARAKLNAFQITKLKLLNRNEFVTNVKTITRISDRDFNQIGRII